MDFQLDILLPGLLNLNELDLKEAMIHWGEETFHRDPPAYIWCNHPILQRCNLPITYGPPLDEHIDFNEYHVYNFNGSLVDDLEMAVNKGKVISTNPIIKFINNLVSKNYGGWVILSLDDEKIEVIKNISFQYSFLSLLVDGLKWERPHGVAILYNSHLI